MPSPRKPIPSGRAISLTCARCAINSDRLEPRDQFLAGFDRRHVDLVASHAALPAKGPRPYTAAVRESNWACTARAAQRRVICLQPRAYVRHAHTFFRRMTWLALRK